MKNFLSLKQVIENNFLFFEIAKDPAALYYELVRNGERIKHGVLRRSFIEKLRDEGKSDQIIDFIAKFTSYQKEASLPDNAIYFPVPMEKLKFPEDENLDLFKFAIYNPEILENPEYKLIHKSSFDHSVWDIDGNRVLMPTLFTLWGSTFDLHKLAAHLKQFPSVISLNIIKNPVCQNWDISGYELGKLVLDPSKLPPENCHLYSRKWIEDHVIHGFFGQEFDYLQLKSFRLE